MVSPLRAAKATLYSCDVRSIIVLVSIGTIFGGIALFLTRGDGFWSPDSAVRAVQVASLAHAGARDGSVPYPAATIDPQGRFFPLGPWFHFTRGGKYYLSYPPYFALLEAPFFLRLGTVGLVLIPLAAGVASAAVLYGFLLSRAPMFALLGATAFAYATPLLIYSTVFWDHTIVIALAISAVVLGIEALERAATYPLAGAGFLVGVGFWFRNEMYPFAAAFLAAWWWTARRDRPQRIAAFLAGLGLAAGPLWTLNARLVGSILGWKGEGAAQGRVEDTMQALTGHRALEWISEKLGNAYYQLISPDYYRFDPWAIVWGAVLAALLLTAAVLLRAGVSRRSERWIAGGSLLGILAGVIIAASRTDVSGLLPSMPLVIFVALPGPLSRWERFLWVLAVVFTTEILLLGTHGGLQWGPRYLLPLFPVLVILAVAALERAMSLSPDMWPALRLSAGALVLVGALVQASGVDQVAQAIARNSRINALIRSVPSQIVATPLQWLTLGAGPLYFEKTLMLVETPDDLRTLVARLAERKVSRWTYVPLSGPLFRPQGIEQESASYSWRFRVSGDRTVDGIRFVTFTGTGESNAYYPH